MTDVRVWDQAVVGADGVGSLVLQPPTRDDYVITRILCSATTPGGSVASGGNVVTRDPFLRTVSNGWGSPDIGGAWTILSGAAADYSVPAGNGLGQILGAGALHAITTLVGTPDMDILCEVITSNITDDSIRVLGRVIDANNYYFVEAQTLAGGQLNPTVLIKKRVGGVETQLGSGITTTFTIATGWIRFNISGINISLTGWDLGTTEPAVQANIIDLDLSAAGDCGAGHGVVGNARFAQFYVVGGTVTDAPTWYAYIGNTTLTNIVDTSETAKTQWVPLLVNGLRLFQGEALIVQATGAAVGTTVVLSAYIQQV